MIKRETVHIFDLILKQLIRLSSVAVIQFINGLFDANHPLDSTVEYPSTETVSKKLRKLMSDTIVIIGGIHTYHIEGEIGDDANIALKVFEYGFAEGLRTKSAGEGDNVIEVCFPKARIIYWETTGKTPDEVTLRLRFPDGKHHDYNVRTFKFLDHDISELEKQKMAILLPFYVLKLRKRVISAKTSKRRAELAREMKSLFNELVTAVDRSAEAGLMSEPDKRIVLEHMDRLYKELYSPYREFREADTMLQERILTYSEEAAEKAAAKAAEKTKFEVAQKMLMRGMALPDIAEIAGLPLDKLQTLL
ncbi:MAG: hypothetical protein LBS00_01445 [Synergistaceae bacterium]|nr:hypothetical protein [Synergistaceae bacterium]